jgi:hypothetical protein
MYEETGAVQNKQKSEIECLLEQTELDTCMFTDDASELSKLRLMENSASDKHIDRREQAQFRIG